VQLVKDVGQTGIYAADVLLFVVDGNDDREGVATPGFAVNRKYHEVNTLLGVPAAA